MLEVGVEWRILSDEDICALVYSTQIPLTTFSQETNAVWKLGKHGGNEICYRLLIVAPLAYKFKRHGSVWGECVFVGVRFPV